MPFSRFRVSHCSHPRASSIASLIDCSVSLLAANTAFLLSPFSDLRVFAVFALSQFSRFRRFRVFAVFAFSPFSGFRVFAFSFSQVDSSRFRVFVLSHVQSWRFRATEWTASVYALHIPKALTTFVFIVLRNGPLRYILYTCPRHPKALIAFVFKVLRNGLLRYKTRQPEKENTFLPFSSFRGFIFPCFSHLRASLIGSAIFDCSVFLFSAKTAFLLCAFSRFCRFRVFAVFAFSFFPVFVLGVFAVFGFSRFRVPPAAPPRPGHRFRMHS